MLKPVNGHILVKPTVIAKSETGLTVVSDAKKEYGTVMHAGDTDLAVGQTVFYKNYSEIGIEVDREEPQFIKYDEVIAVEE